MPSRRRSPPEKTLNPELCQAFVISSISSSGTLTALIAAGSAWWMDSSASKTSDAIEVVSAIETSSTVISSPTRTAETQCWSRRASSTRNSLSGISRDPTGSARRLFFFDAVEQLAPRQQRDDLEIGRGQHPHAGGHRLVDRLARHDALFAHHRHAGMLVQPVHRISGNEWPAT